MKRVVVTGLGMISPLASGVEPTWRRLLAGQSAVARVESGELDVRLSTLERYAAAVGQNLAFQLGEASEEEIAGEP